MNSEKQEAFSKVPEVGSNPTPSVSLIEAAARNSVLTNEGDRPMAR
jgi:hypothetical protein